MVEKAFKENFEEPMAKRIKEGKFNPKGLPKKDTGTPDKKVLETPKKKPRIPLNVPPPPKAGSTIPGALQDLSQPKAATKMKWAPPPIPGTAPKAGSPIPKAGTNTLPKAGDVLPQNPVRPQMRRPMGAALPPTAWSPGASMDSSYDPARGQPTYIKDAEEARFADRAAQNFEKRDWYDTLSEEQKADHLARFRTNNAR
jgi:hypothetical protein